MNNFEDFIFNLRTGSFVLFIVGGIIVITMLITLPSAWFMSCRQADFINKYSNIKVTCSDVFWAGDLITSQVQTIKLR